MRRRSFLALAGSIGAPSGLLAQAGQWRVGFLHPGQSVAVAMRLVAFREGLGRPDTGGEAVVLEGIAEERAEELPGLAAKLVRDGAQALCAVASPGVRAALSATRTLPIVAVDLESDPVGNGWVATLSRPAGNVTGVFLDVPDFTGKCVQLLREAIPRMTKLALLWHPASGSVQLNAARRAAAAVGLTVEVYEASRIVEFEPAFRAMAAGGADGALMLSSPLFGGNSQLMAELALRNRLSAINQFPDFAERGGLMAYGPELQALYRQSGAMVRKVLQGAPISELPIDRPSRFKLVVNLKTATVLGLELPATLLARADEVIE